MSATVLGLDAPGTSCAFGKACSRQMIGAGGFDQHHPWPMDTGGPRSQTLVNLCPNHHRRQHSLVHYLINCDQAATPPAVAVIRRFTALERGLAQQAVAAWVAAGKPTVTGWPCPAAREV